MTFPTPTERFFFYLLYRVPASVAWVSDTLKTFDFERHSLVMLALW
ncbi:TPA: hypothetical protein HJP36_004395 [Escherichia coli]|nr:MULTISPECIES: hypothetical protein [Enterobacteriaceae]EHP1246515.1 hypothetical protein [Salmonella enterica]EEZ1436295.1 hypothetical protein [Escherichia coli]EFE0663662.1 hypothetical protein [Escherichia coli]EFG5904630.1 hypothetical protein [Escherichia coli]EFG6649544.1 hypothetical protein [Escherichia coli]